MPDQVPDAPRRSRRHATPRPLATDAPRGIVAAPRRPSDVITKPFRTVAVSNGRQVRLSTTSSPVGRAVVLRAYARERPSAPMEPIGRQFTVFHADLPAIMAALAEAGAALDRLSD